MPKEPGSTPMRRLTRFEYDNAVRDLLGDTTGPARSFVADAEVLGFDNQASSQAVSQLQAEEYLDAAEALAATAVGDLGRILPCDPAPDEEGCARAFIASFGKKAYRRDLSVDERGRILDLYRNGREGHDFANGIGMVIEAILQSPHFLYRIEFGVADAVHDDVVPLTPAEVASRLSFFLWGTLPDDTLTQAADQGELSSSEGIGRHAKRMLADGRARESVSHFHEQWLGLAGVDNLTKDVSVYPTYNGELRPQWREETLGFVDHVIFEGSGTLNEILTAPYTMADRDLAQFYGVSGPEGDDFERVDLDPSERAGILTQSSILGLTSKPNQSSPVLRGKFVRERLLCQRMPPPPANMPIVVPAVSPDASTRERFDAHRTDPACAGCHQLLDPLGYGFEHYDGVGLWRDTDGGGEVDATGQISGTRDVDGGFDGAVELAHRLAASEEVQRCVVSQWFRYGFARAERAEDGPTVRRLELAFRSSGFDVRALMIAITESDAFRFRHAVEPGL